MKVSKRQLKKLIREACGDLAGEESMVDPMADSMAEPMTEMPCPYGTADALRDSGASDAEVLEWVSTLLASFQGGGEFSFTGDVGELGGDEAFGVGYEAGSMGLR
jgi:hypothetical protein